MDWESDEGKIMRTWEKREVDEAYSSSEQVQVRKALWLSVSNYCE